MKKLHVLIFGIIAVLGESTLASPLTLDNGTIKVSVDTSYGGAITYLSQSDSSKNLINDYDHGRQVQQSYYSGPSNFLPAGAIQNPSYSPWPWNPVQAGEPHIVWRRCGTHDVFKAP